MVCSFAFAVGEQNASGEKIVTAPTCGAAGVLPAVLYYQQRKHRFSDSQIVKALITAGIGLIPNCASSVVVTQSFLSGGITFGAMIAGLCANAGLGFVVLLKNVKEWKRNLALIAVCYAVSVLVGTLFNAIGLFI